MTRFVLLAEDEEHIARLISFKLERDGFTVMVAKNGEEALSLFPTRDWSAVILDVMMPVRDGWQVLKEIRSRDTDVPVLMLTAKGDPQAIASAAELGATDFVKKPFDPSALSAKVREVIRESQGAWDSDRSETDPEMRAMVLDFIASFAGRATSLEEALVRLQKGEIVALARIQEIAHKLAGVAENMGFPALSLIGGALDDYLGAKEPPQPGDALRFGSLFLRAIREAQQKEADPIDTAADSATLELISVSESRVSGASSGSS